MAYQFVRTNNDSVEFAIAPFSGYTFGAFTWAVFLRRAETFARDWFEITTTSYGHRFGLQDSSATALRWISGSGSTANSAGSVWSGTTLWYLVVFTWDGAAATRYHIHDGTSWVHGNTDGAAVATTIASDDRLRIGGRSLTTTFSADVVCAGIKKSDSSDATVQTLSRTAFSAWQSFGFHWLIGFDSSLESGGILQDQGSIGTGDESSIAGTTQVADPPGWTWAGGGGGAVFVPRVISIT